MSKIIVENNKFEFNGSIYPCAVGAGGIALKKSEGDLKTPSGVFPIRRIFVRQDKISNLSCALPLEPINPDDGWCDDVQSLSYNTYIKLPSPTHHEKLWRNDDTYDIVLVLGYNDNPPVPGLGSAIFIHVAKDGLLPTAGCVALSKSDLINILSQITIDTLVEIKA